MVFLCVVSKVRGNIMNEFRIGNLDFLVFYGCETWSSHYGKIIGWSVQECGVKMRGVYKCIIGKAESKFLFGKFWS